MVVTVYGDALSIREFDRWYSYLWTDRRRRAEVGAVRVACFPGGAGLGWYACYPAWGEVVAVSGPYASKRLALRGAE